jgi:D-alanine-D-alanine ligase
VSRRLTVAVISGGSSSEREVSLRSGRACLDHLDPARYEPRTYDPATDLERLVREAGELDAAVVMLHGRGGEDGTVQGLLDLLGVPYQSAGVLGCALAMHKPMAKALYRAAGIPVAPELVLRPGQADPAGRVLEGLGLPVVVKPASEGSSFGVAIVRRAEDLAPAIAAAFELDRLVLAEAFLQGREITGAVIGNQELEALPLVEIIPGDKHAFFDYQAKYQPGASQEICPAPLEPETTRAIQGLAAAAHRALGLEGYSRSDFILTAGGPVILETNTIPGMTETSLLPQAAAAAGMSFGQLLDRLLGLALERAGG